MKIIINGWYGNSNLGDEILLISVLKLIKKNFINSSVTVCTLDINYTKALLKKFNLSANLIDKSDKNLSFKKEFIKLVFRSDYYIYGGGTAFRDFTFANAIITHLKFTILAWVLRTKVIYLSIGVGPIWKNQSKFSIFIISLISKIFVRDLNSQKILKKITFKSPEILPDLCFSNAISNFKQIKNKNKSYKIGFALRSWETNQSNISEKISLSEKIGQFINNSNYKDFTFFCLESGNNIPLNDRKYLNKIKFPKNINLKFEILDIKNSLDEVFNKISKVDVLVGMRLHSLILGSMLKIPLISIEYDPKIKSFMDELNIGSYNINLDQFSSEKLTEKINEINLQKYSLNNILKKYNHAEKNFITSVIKS